VTLAERVLAGDPRAIARAISLVEDEHAAAVALIRSIFGRTGRAYLIGVTGPPGAGKSTLVDRIVFELRRSGTSVGVIAVDPTSPFSGGAVLGDRLRMQAHAADEGVFIRSMATRGHLGGLARATGDAAIVLDAAGREIIVIETVGVGQDEVDIVRTADVSIVTLVPGTGDEVQALKAGIMEIGDIFVINKADREGVERTERELIALLEMSERPGGPGGKEVWRPPIVRTVATQNKGIVEFAEAIENFAEFRRAHQSSLERRVNVAQNRIIELLRERLLRLALDEALAPGQLRELAEQVASRRRDPYSIVDEIAGKIRME
jgi:LAO/AO transport system kinase